jgi:hypothetical protein
MNTHDNRRALQIAVAVAALVPVGAGLAGVLIGPTFAGLGSQDSVAQATASLAGISLDSHFRYLSGMLLAIGLVFWMVIPTIERRGALVRALTLIVVIGGLGRLLSLFEVGEPGSLGMRLALIMELVITPLICLWQRRVELQYLGPSRRPHPDSIFGASTFS